jgi:hypothetical protein
VLVLISLLPIPRLARVLALYAPASHASATDAAGRLGVRRWHVSLTHDAGVSVAFVVAEA